MANPLPKLDSQLRSKNQSVRAAWRGRPSSNGAAGSPIGESERAIRRSVQGRDRKPIAGRTRDRKNTISAVPNLISAVLPRQAWRPHELRAVTTAWRAVSAHGDSRRAPAACATPGVQLSRTRADTTAGSCRPPFRNARASPWRTRSLPPPPRVRSPGSWFRAAAAHDARARVRSTLPGSFPLARETAGSVFWCSSPPGARWLAAEAGAEGSVPSTPSTPSWIPTRPTEAHVR